MRTVKVGTKPVGDSQPVYIVAEAGSNHNGSLEQALALIDVAAEAGVDAVKFQHFKASKLYPKSAGQSDYLKTAKPIYEIIREMETPDEWVPYLAAHCREREVAFLSSPFDEESADLLEPYVPAYKLASYEMTCTPLLRHLARKGKPLMLSTGTSTLDEVLQAVEVVLSEGNDQIIILQCTASYPAPLDAVNARAISTLREATAQLVGLSDHSRNPIIAPVLAVALGACLVEKHFTLSNRLPGPDHRFAVEPHELAQMVRSIRQAEQALGHGRKELLPVEEELHDFARRSIFAIREIAVGEVLSNDNIAALRCGKLGFGLPPEQYDSLLGRVVTKSIPAESLVRLEDLE